jgi:hypothetical protein
LPGPDHGVIGSFFIMSSLIVLALA